MILKALPLKFAILIYLYLFSSLAFAGGIKGTIKNNKGDVLSFVSIIVKGNTAGTIANEEGKYELALSSGIHEIYFQHLGYKTIARKVEIGADFFVLDVVMEEQTLSLAEVKILSGNEDPAYTIMRKAISMSRIHVLEVDSYTARSYVKGNFQVKSVSGITKMLIGKKVEKEFGIKIGTTYVLESINDLSFTRPNTVKERVVSGRNNFPAKVLSQGDLNIQVVQQNFYHPKIEGMISPLSPSAFSYYKFSYLGSFEDRGQSINKIKLVPKSRGADVFEGVINIIEDTWAIHSLDLKFFDENAKYQLKQVSAPFKDVWMPVSYDMKLTFDAFGLNADSRYIYNIRNYNLKINPKYHQQPVVIDERIDKVEAKALTNTKKNALAVLPDKEVTRKQLKKLVQQMEKVELKDSIKKPVRDYSFEIDTLAKKRSEAFWNEERLVPLTEIESKAFVQAQADSSAKIKKDTLKNDTTFKFVHLLMGKTYNYGKRDNQYGYPERLTFSGLFQSVPKLDFYNSVEGYYLNTSLNYQKRNKAESVIDYGAKLRYSFARERLNGILDYGYSFNQLHDKIFFSAGRFTFQFNEQSPVSPLLNTVTSLFLEKNYMKLYEKSFAKMAYTKWFSQKLTATSSFEYSYRTALENSHFEPWIDRKLSTYNTNNPINNELTNTQFPNHNSMILDISLQVRPFAQEGKYNGRSYSINNGKPTFTLKSKNGLGSENSFNHLQLDYSQRFELQKLGDLQVLASAGGFLKSPNYFVDFKHFNTYPTIFSDNNINVFKLMDFYTFSTQSSYLEGHANNVFRKFLLTQIPMLRFYGIKENLFVNYLYTQKQKDQYAELGYGISGIGKVAGIEVIASFLNGKYQQTGLRLKVPFN